MTALHQAAQKAVEALKEGRRAIGDHYAPDDCYATGPLTGDPIRDLVQCPACTFIAMHDAALASLESTLQQQPEPVAKPSRVGEDGWRKLAESQAALLALQQQEVPREPVADPETMVLNYEPRNGRSFWHSDCSNHFGGIVQEVQREEGRSLMECLHCYKRGYYAKGWVGRHTVPVEPNGQLAASPSTTQQPQGELISDERILHLWDSYVGDPSAKYPLGDADKLQFARAVLRAAALAPSTTQQQEAPSDGVWEALQRMIENAATLGPACQEDALLVARWRGRFVAARERATQQQEAGNEPKSEKKQ